MLPAIATEAADYLTGPDEVHHRPVGQLLQPDRDSLEAIEELKREVGSRVFAAQYQQNPTPPGGNMIKAAWLGRYNTVPDRKNLQRVVLSCELLRITDYCQERVSLFSEPSRIADHCVLGPSNSALNSGPTMPRDCPE